MNGALFLLFFGTQFRNVAYATYLWQLKEYRFDRMRSHLRTQQGRRWIIGTLSILKWILLVVYFLGFSSLIPFIAALLLESGLFVRDIIHGLKFPIPTTKALGIISTTLFVETLLFFLFSFILPVRLLLIDKLRPLILGTLVLLLNQITNFQRSLIIKKAKDKLMRYPNLITIGITGSYGKTSTKEFLATILSGNYNVLKTEKTINTEIGVAETILNNLKPEHQVFIAEMGAYKKGEIRRICEVVKPKYGVLTAINEQHLELFGSLEETAKAKYELIDLLPDNGVAFFNSANHYAKKLAAKARVEKRIKVVEYGVRDENNLSIHHIAVAKESLSFDLVHKKDSIKVKMQLLGTHNIENLLGAISVALELGLSLDEIKKALNLVTPFQHTLAPAGEYKETFLVDDTFNTNPQAVKAACDYMKIFKGKRILVLQPMIELGEKAHSVHQEIGSYIGKSCDYLFLTNSSFLSDLEKGAEGTKLQIKVNSPSAIAHFVKNLNSKENVIVCEGREAGNVLQLVQNFDEKD